MLRYPTLPNSPPCFPLRRCPFCNLPALLDKDMSLFSCPNPRCRKVSPLVFLLFLSWHLPVPRVRPGAPAPRPSCSQLRELLAVTQPNVRSFRVIIPSFLIAIFSFCVIVGAMETAASVFGAPQCFALYQNDS